MEELALLLARIHFGFSTAAHIMWPSLTIGLGVYLAYLNTLYYRTQNKLYLDMFDRWKTVFAIAFGLGVVSGVPLSLLLGGQWSEWARVTSPVLGPLIGYEVLSAFFLEAGFLGIALWGRNRVSPLAHLISTYLVAIGTFGSAFWILSANSWMQTPTGYSVNELGQFIPEDWMEIIFNPSFGYRFFHMAVAAFLTTGLVVTAVGAYHTLTKQNIKQAKHMLRHGIVAVALLAPTQAVIGDLHGLNTLEYQPAKVAAMEGIYHDEQEAGWIVFGIPNNETKEVDYAVEIPYAASLILTHHATGEASEIKGLESFEYGEDIPVGTVFWSFRIMIALGCLMIALGAWGMFEMYKGRLDTNRRFLQACMVMGPTGWIAVFFGWVVSESGRQPFSVYGLLTTRDSFSNLTSSEVIFSLAAFGIAYAIAFSIGMVFMMKAANKEMN
ncbi:MAG: cytochrome ubiquinol oxidase subunit I [Candidatus Thiodiazotropha taylori]|uniref:Cytochrome ubiquinol oxidase subunit I n=1 Tax=Candidatus Thiodiazotropha taylori TaxID=2792791 RepID=A0A9E4KAY5_9GAMM|nr:cytochrome ubiquinol oxidase subunit I [Candidatus Thiodiazotropha taylori]MCW4255109.1 cytochrome ubiquinol oxidase subunit I [Candidatus Thiodiazotropha taylori]